VVLCATNDLAQDQRLHKMACTLADAGYSPWLVGRLRPHSQPMAARRYFFTRMRLRFGRGKLFYLEYNLRLFWRLLRMRIDILTANDLDTLPACFAIALLRRIPLVYDSHEYFSGSAELAQRPLERAIWRGLEQLLLPLLPTRLTVSQQVVDAYRADGYGFALVRNLPYALPAPSPPPAAESRILLYQGMLNAGRGLPWLVEALPLLPGWQAWIVGDGVMRAPLEAQARQLGVAHRIRWWGMQPFQQLPHITAQASIGLSIEDNESLRDGHWHTRCSSWCPTMPSTSSRPSWQPGSYTGTGRHRRCWNYTKLPGPYEQGRAYYLPQCALAGRLWWGHSQLLPPTGPGRGWPARASAHFSVQPGTGPRPGPAVPAGALLPTPGGPGHPAARALYCL